MRPVTSGSERPRQPQDLILQRHPAVSKPGVGIDGAWFSRQHCNDDETHAAGGTVGTTSRTVVGQQAEPVLGINAPSGFNGYYLDIQNDGTELFPLLVSAE